MNSEIKVNQSKLQDAITILSCVVSVSGTGYLSKGQPVTQSVGEVADALNEIFFQMCITEGRLLSLIGELQAKLVEAGIELEQMDQFNARFFLQIHAMLKGQ